MFNHSIFHQSVKRFIQPNTRIFVSPLYPPCWLLDSLFLGFESGPPPPKKKENYSLSIPHLEVSWNGGTPKSSILMGVSLINQPLWIAPFMEPPLVVDCPWRKYKLPSRKHRIIRYWERLIAKQDSSNLWNKVGISQILSVFTILII